MQSFDDVKPEQYVGLVHKAALQHGSIEALEKALRGKKSRT
jgi:hypothetical protein